MDEYPVIFAEIKYLESPEQKNLSQTPHWEVFKAKKAQGPREPHLSKVVPAPEALVGALSIEKNQENLLGFN